MNTPTKATKEELTAALNTAAEIEKQTETFAASLVADDLNFILPILHGAADRLREAQRYLQAKNGA